MKIIAMIPARIGSQRLKFKNLALLNKKPLIYYSINAAKSSKIFDDIYLNSDDQIFENISKRYSIKFYSRKKKLGSSNTKSDDVVYDFLKNNFCDILVWVNPIAPLIQKNEIKDTVNYFIKKNLNSLITTSYKQAHLLYKKKPINYNLKEKFSKTQDLIPLEYMNYSLMMWKRDSFIKQFEKKGFAMLHGKVGHYQISDQSSLNVKYLEDLRIINEILKYRKNKKSTKLVKYDKILNQ